MKPKNSGQATAKSKRRPDRPTERELDILDILWTHGPSTNRDVHEVLSEIATVRQTTTLNMLQIMIQKGWVLRDDSIRPQIYRANVTRQKTQRVFSITSKMSFSKARPGTCLP